MAAFWTCAGSAFAHFPVSRGVAVAPGGKTAIALPGFGIAIRSAAAEPFSYVCDGLLEVVQSDVPVALSFAADGSLLIGSGSGLRSVDASGCPRADVGGELRNQPLARLAVHPTLPSVVYAVTDGNLPQVWRSQDGGTTWERRASLRALSPVTALVLEPDDADVVHVSQAIAGNGSLLHSSKDGGATFSVTTQEKGLTLLDVAEAGDAGTGRWWAVGRSAGAMGLQGFSLFGATSASGPWSPVFDVRFFGGFAREPSGALWLGDEAGGVYRSTDSGGSFTNLSSTTAVSCLDFAQGSLWGCTPGIAEQNALVTWNATSQAFDGVITLSHVTRLAQCSPATNVANKCAAAWVEWQRDILMLPQTPPDAGTPPAGTGGSPSMPDAGHPLPGTGGRSTNPMESSDASMAPVGGSSGSSGCAMRDSRGSGSSVTAVALGALCFGVTVRRRRRVR